MTNEEREAKVLTGDRGTWQKYW